MTGSCIHMHLAQNHKARDTNICPGHAHAVNHCSPIGDTNCLPIAIIPLTAGQTCLLEGMTLSWDMQLQMCKLR